MSKNIVIEKKRTYLSIGLFTLGLILGMSIVIFWNKYVTL